MFVAKVKRVANPHKAKKHKTAKKRVKRAANGRFQKKAKKTVKKNSKRKATKRKSNPAHLLTLGFVGNPHKKTKRSATKKMATKTKRKSAKRVAAAKKAARTRKRHLAAKSNPAPRRRKATRRRHTTAKRRKNTRIIVMAPKRRNGRGRRKNPQLFGMHLTPLNMAKAVAGGLVGVTATKAIVPMLPASLISSPIGATVAAIAVAIAGGWAVSKVSPEFGSAFTFGGLMQAGSVLLNAYVPGASQFALQGGRGLGEFVPGSFPIPQVPVLTAGSMGMGGAAGRPSINRAYPRPY